MVVHTIVLDYYNWGSNEITQCAERILNEIGKPLNETFTGLMCILQGLRICFVQNP